MFRVSRLACDQRTEAVTVADKVAQLLRDGVGDINQIAERAGTTRAYAWNVLNRLRIARKAKSPKPGRWVALSKRK